MVVANHTPGHITGIDLFPVFIDIFNVNSRKLNLQDRVNGVAGSMDHLPFQNEELDLMSHSGMVEIPRLQAKKRLYCRYATL
jgi:ubiquinone/menaquinone biosynthesis C-methylase UbiE